jgi:hypothetical protein
MTKAIRPSVAPITPVRELHEKADADGVRRRAVRRELPKRVSARKPSEFDGRARIVRFSEHAFRRNGAQRTGESP